MEPAQVLELLGHLNNDPVVESALMHYSVRNRPAVRIDRTDADGPVVETQSWVKNSHAGIEFGFDDEAAWRALDETQFGKLPMILTQIYFYGHHDGVQPYRDALPFGLRLSDDRSTARRRLQEYERTRHSYIRDTWDTPQFRITVAYVSDDTAIDFILCALREPPLPQLPYDLAKVPSLSVLVEALGRHADDPVLVSAFAPLGVTDRMAQIAETGEADFLNSYGVSLGFSIPLDRSGQNLRTLVLSRVLLCSDRELDARAWAGDLPFGITFDDSPEGIERKVGHAPDEHDDDFFTSYVLWHETRFSLHLLFNTMENRVARVILIAPGYWKKWHQDDLR